MPKKEPFLFDFDKLEQQGKTLKPSNVSSDSTSKNDSDFNIDSHSSSNSGNFQTKATKTKFNQTPNSESNAKNSDPAISSQKKKSSFFKKNNWTADDDSGKVARIVFSQGPDGFFDYFIPRPLLTSLNGGMRVLVPLGQSRTIQGYCVGIFDRTELEQQRIKDGKDLASFVLKPLEKVIDEKRLLSDEMLALTKWIADYYLCSWGQVLDAVLPIGVKTQSGTRLTTILKVIENVQQKIKELEELRKTQKIALLTEKQKFVLNILANSGVDLTAAELARTAKCSMVPISALKKLGLISEQKIRRTTELFNQPLETARQIQDRRLNPDQQRALNQILDAVAQERHETFLLHGVTGSGKTEVYIQAIKEVVKQGKQAIVLVPEISLTPQTVGRFRERFDQIAVLHSHLTDVERHRQWTLIAEGKVQVVVGARSAIFAPVVRPGMIIIDEEHESSFKQESVPRYHARDVAEYRARLENIPLILGSATPSLESWYRQLTKRYTYLSMPARVRDLPLPAVHILDLRMKDLTDNGRGAIHRQLHIAVKEALDQGGQVILLLNRRGFSTQIQCPACGEALRCPQCDVSLTHHRVEEVALCHYCDYQIPVPRYCPKCGFGGMRFSGFGTQRLEQEIHNRFPDVPVLRMDTDTMQGHGAHEKALSAFREGKYRILLGTQMIAKGLDFPNVVLVGVINADTALHIPDFRASERTFHLITQVAGRTGRSEKGGHVIVQTFNPDHPAIVAASTHNYRQFVLQEMPTRRGLGFPPFAAMMRFIVRGPDEKETEIFAQTLADCLREKINQVNDLHTTAVNPTINPNVNSVVNPLQESIDNSTNNSINSSTNNSTNNSTDKSTNSLSVHLSKENGTPTAEQLPKRLLKGRLLGPAPAPFSKLRNFYRFHLLVQANNSELLHEAVRLLLKEKIKTPREVQWIVDVDPLEML